MNNNQFSQTNSQSSDHAQFVISYELLCLLRWLVDHDYEKFKKMITRALHHGLKYDLDHIQHRTRSLTEADAAEIQQSIVEFFSLLETALIDSLNDYAVQKALEKKLLPTIEHIDTTICDDATVQASIEQACPKIEHTSADKAQQVLFKELLKRWKPQKKHALN